MSDSDDDAKPAKASKGRASAASTKRKQVADSDEEDVVKPKKSTNATASSSSSSRATKARKVETDDDDMDEDPPAKKPTKSSPAKTSKAGSSRTAAIDLDDEEEDVKPAAKKPTPKKAAPKPAPVVTKPEPATDKELDDKEALRLARARAAAGPSAPGSKEIPQGQPDCLEGLSFVFTGQLESIDRDDAQSLVKRYGAKVTGQPSSKTSYVILGEGAGPSKLKKIKELKVNTLDEDGLLELIRTRPRGKPDAAAMKKIKAEEDKIKKAAASMDVSAGAAGVGHKGGPTKSADFDMHSLWTTKYAPTAKKDLVGNNAAIEKLELWLSDWPKSYKANFKKPGKNAMNTYRAVMISGPPGIGKTTAAHLISRQLGYNPIELNASDTRSKKLIESSLKSIINNKSLDGWYGGGQMTAEGVTIQENSVLILDEVDGMSGGDRGGIGAINQLIKKTKVPIILIANDRKNQKMTPFNHTTANLAFQRPKADSLRSRLQTIAFREKMKVEKQAMDQLIASAGNDMRLVINMLSTWKLGQMAAMTYDDSRALGAQNTKPGNPTPFNLYNDLSSPGLWSAANKKNLNQKADLYFQDHSMIPLFVQENYIKQRPANTSMTQPIGLKDYETLRLLSEASQSISDGEMVSELMHGGQQWSLMPVHAIFSTIKPMSLVYGMGPEGQWGPSFPSWFGNYSKGGRLMRATVELQTKMRLSASGSRTEVREDYLPHMFTGLSKPMLEDEKGGVEAVVSMMDDYFLNLEDRNSVLELGVGPNDGEAILKKMSTQAKSSFTRNYNSQRHPIAYQRGEAGSASKIKQLKGDAAPDAEEAMQEDDDIAGEDESANEDAGGDSDEDDKDLGKDKLIKEKKPKGKGKSKK